MGILQDFTHHADTTKAASPKSPPRFPTCKVLQKTASSSTIVTIVANGYHNIRVMFVRWGRTKVTFLKFPRALVAAPELYDDIVAHVGNSDGLLVSEGGERGG